MHSFLSIIIVFFVIAGLNSKKFISSFNPIIAKTITDLDVDRTNDERENLKTQNVNTDNYYKYRYDLKRYLPRI